MYSYFRRIRSVGRVRAWRAAKADRAAWDGKNYPPPPDMPYPGIILILGSRADLTPSYRRVNRYSHVRGLLIESQKKVQRLHKRRKARRYRAYHKKTGQW